jgi:hypothetical protein
MSAYDTLGVSCHADNATVRAAYLHAVSRAHPDRVRGPRHWRHPLQHSRRRPGGRHGRVQRCTGGVRSAARCASVHVPPRWSTLTPPPPRQMPPRARRTTRVHAAHVRRALGRRAGLASTALLQASQCVLLVRPALRRRRPPALRRTGATSPTHGAPSSRGRRTRVRRQRTVERRLKLRWPRASQRAQWSFTPPRCARWVPAPMRQRASCILRSCTEVEPQLMQQRATSSVLQRIWPKQGRLKIRGDNLSYISIYVVGRVR